MTGQNLRPSGSRPRINKSPSIQAINKLLEASLKNTGFNIDEINALFKEHNAEVRQATRLMTPTSSEYFRSPAALSCALKNLRNRLSGLQAATPSEPFIVLGTAGEIDVPPDALHVSTTIAAENNSARFVWAPTVADTGADFGGPVLQETVAFRFFWQNPNNAPTEVDVTGLIVLDGVCDVQSDGGVLPGDRFCDASIVVRLEIQELWNNPVTEPPDQPAQSQEVLRVQCDSGGFFDPSADNSANISNEFVMTHNGLIVPPNGPAIFNVRCELNVFANAASASFGFTAGSGVLCPGVVVGIRS